jgi:transposase InsO family protein
MVKAVQELEEENRTLHDVRELTEAWMTDYNECRPHESLDNMTPMEYREKKKVG